MVYLCSIIQEKINDMKLDNKATELRTKFFNQYAKSAGESAAVEAFENPAILSGVNAFMQMIADMHAAGFDGEFDETKKPERAN